VTSRPLTASARLGFTTLTLLFVAALGLRLWQIDRKNVWLDEASAWNTARQPIASLVDMTGRDVHPPLYYVVLKGWMALAGDSPAALRGLSALCGAIAVLLAVLLASRWMPRGMALLAGIWMIVSPHMMEHGQEMRMYALLTAVVLGVCLAFWRWLESGGTHRGALAAYVLLGAMALWVHYFAVLALAAIWIVFTLATLQRSVTLHPPGVPGALSLASSGQVWRRWLAANTVMATMYLPWIPTAVAHITRGQDWRQPVSFIEVPGYAAVFVKEVLAGPHFGISPALGAASLALTVVASAGWLSLLLRQLAARRVDAGTFLLVVCGVPLAATLALLPVSGHMQVSRYLAYLTPLVVLGVAWGWTGPGRRSRVAWPVMAVAALASAVWLAAYFRDTEKDIDLRPAASALVRDWTTTRSNGSARAAVASTSGTTIPLRYILRDAPDIAVIDIFETAPLTRAVDLALASAADGPVWIMVDPRWPGWRTFDAGADPRLVEIDVPERGRTKARLFRIR
jgi:uncharacterized membrane protein